jgi:hypothetical protein
MVDRLLALKARLEAVQAASFRRSSAFGATLRDALSYALNTRCGAAGGKAAAGARGLPAPPRAALACCCLAPPPPPPRAGLCRGGSAALPAACCRARRPSSVSALPEFPPAF